MELFENLFNSQTLANMAIISTLVTAIRNVVKLKGAAAVVLTFMVSVTYGVLQFGLADETGVAYGGIVGIATALTFYVSKNVGAVLSIFLKPRGFQHETTNQIIQRQNSQLDETPTIWQITKFILFRKL